MVITHARLVLAMIIPKPFCCFIFPLMLIKTHYNHHRRCNVSAASSSQNVKVPIHLPFFLFNLTLNRLLSPQTRLPPSAKQRRAPKPPVAMAISSSGSNSIGSPLSPSSSSSSVSSLDPISESREPMPEYNPTAAHEALAPLHHNAEV